MEDNKGVRSFDFQSRFALHIPGVYAEGTK